MNIQIYIIQAVINHTGQVQSKISNLQRHAILVEPKANA